MISRLQWLPGGLLALACGLVFLNEAAAQDAVLRGRVLAGSQPVPGQIVSVHHVTDAGGNTVGTDTTDADGRFELRLESLPPAGVLFGAARYQGMLYIGAPFRGTVPAAYEIAVGPGATPVDLSSAQVPSSPEPATVTNPSDRRNGLAVIGTVAVVLGGSAFLLWRGNRPPRRRLLVEIAELDERHASRPVRDYDERRHALIERLRETV